MQWSVKFGGDPVQWHFVLPLFLGGRQVRQEDNGVATGLKSTGPWSSASGNQVTGTMVCALGRQEEQNSHVCDAGFHASNLGSHLSPAKWECMNLHGAAAVGRDVCPLLCLFVATTEAAIPACQGSPLPTDKKSLAVYSLVDSGWCVAVSLPCWNLNQPWDKKRSAGCSGVLGPTIASKLLSPFSVRKTTPFNQYYGFGVPVLLSVKVLSLVYTCACINVFSRTCLSPCNCFFSDSCQHAVMYVMRPRVGQGNYLSSAVACVYLSIMSSSWLRNNINTLNT